MPKFILRLLGLSVLCAGGAFGQVQGTFAQIAYGGSWQTTFTLINLNSGAANVTLFFYGDDGGPLNAPVQGFGNTTAYTFSIPPNGVQNVVLSSPDPTTQGWASMTTNGRVRGQATFRFLLPGGAISEAVVPLSTPSAELCILPIPQPNPMILVPFENTISQDDRTSQHVTALAIANITVGDLDVPIEFDDQSNVPIKTDSLHLTARQHKAFLTAQSYPELAGKKGIVRIRLGADRVTVLGLLANFTNAITTIIPVTQ